MLDRTKSAAEICYDYLAATKLPGDHFRTDELYHLGISPNLVSSSLGNLEKHQHVVKAIGRCPKHKRMFIWEFSGKEHCVFKKAPRRTNVNRPSGYHFDQRELPFYTDEATGHILPQSWAKAETVTEILNIANKEFAKNIVPLEKKLSERLLELAIELEAKGL